MMTINHKINSWEVRKQILSVHFCKCYIKTSVVISYCVLAYYFKMTIFTRTAKHSNLLCPWPVGRDGILVFILASHYKRV